MVTKTPPAPYSEAKMNKQELDEFMADNSLPASTKILGYIVCLPESNEFLHKSRSSKNEDLHVWAQTPEMAKIYKTLGQAKKVAQGHTKGAVAATMLDTGNDYAVVIEDE